MVVAVVVVVGRRARGRGGGGNAVLRFGDSFSGSHTHCMTVALHTAYALHDFSYVFHELRVSKILPLSKTASWIQEAVFAAGGGPRPPLDPHGAA